MEQTMYKEQEEELDIRELFNIIKKRIVLVVILPIICSIGSASVNYIRFKPLYQANVSIIISKEQGNILTPGDVAMYQSLLKTYIEIAKSSAVVEQAVRDANLKISPGALQSSLTVSGKEGTQVIKMSVISGQPNDTVVKVEALANAFLEESKRLLPSGTVNIMDHAKMPQSPINQSMKKNIIIGFVIGLIIAIGIAFLMEFMSDSINSEEDVEKYLGMNNLGVIPKHALGRKQTLSLTVKDNPKSISSEAYRVLRTNLKFFTKDREAKIFVVTSTEHDEGKSGTIGNLAMSLSQSGKKVLIIDCDLRNPSIHEYFTLDNDEGFANLIMDKIKYKDIVKEYSENLHIITAGKAFINPAELLNNEFIYPIFENVKNYYDIILIDSPPVINIADAQLLASAADGVIMVLSLGQTNRKLCQKAMKLLQNVDANIIGVVLSKVVKNCDKNYKQSNRHIKQNKSRRRDRDNKQAVL